MLQELTKDLLKYFPSRVLPALFSIITLPILTRLFSPDEYGTYTLVLSSLSVLSILSTDWITSSTTRFYARCEEKGELGAFYGTTLWSTIITITAATVLSTVALSLSKRWVGESLLTPFLVGLALFVINALFSVLLDILVVKHKPIQYSIYSVGQRCISILAGMGVALLLNMGVVGLLLGSAVGLLMIMPFLVRSVLYGVSRPLAFSRDLQGEMIRYGLPLVATNLGGWVLSLSDRYILQLYKGSYEVGLYSVSYALADRSINLLVSLVILASAPLAMKLWETRGPQETARFIRGLTRYYLITALPVLLAMSLLSRLVLGLFSTPQYLAGHRVMPMVAASIFLYGLQRNFQLGLLFHNKTVVVMYILLASASLNIFLNILIVPSLGYMGAAYTTLGCYTLFTAGIIVVSRNHFRWAFPYLSLLRVGLALALMSGAIEILLGTESLTDTLKLIVAVPLGMVVYFGSLYLFREVKTDSLAVGLSWLARRRMGVEQQTEKAPLQACKNRTKKGGKI